MLPVVPSGDGSARFVRQQHEVKRLGSGNKDEERGPGLPSLDERVKSAGSREGSAGRQSASTRAPLSSTNTTFASTSESFPPPVDERLPLSSSLARRRTRWKNIEETSDIDEMHTERMLPDDLLGVLASIMSQLRWEASRGRRTVKVQHMPMEGDPPRRRRGAGRSPRHQKAKCGGEGLGANRAVATKFEELRRFGEVAREVLSASQSPREMRWVYKHASSMVVASSPGVSGNFVALTEPYQKLFMDLLSHEVQRRRDELIASGSKPLPPIAWAHGPHREDGTAAHHHQTPKATKQRDGSTHSGRQRRARVNSASESVGGRPGIVAPSPGGEALSPEVGPTQSCRSARDGGKMTKMTSFMESPHPEANSDALHRISVAMACPTTKRSSQGAKYKKTPAAAESWLSSGSSKRKEDALGEIFRKFRHDGEIDRSTMPRVLEQVGFVMPEDAWLTEVWERTTKCSSCSQAEFMDIVDGYLEKQRQVYVEHFSLCEADGGGSVRPADIAGLVSQFVDEPMKHVLDELLQEVDCASAEYIVFSDFERVMDLLRLREGFTRREYEGFTDAFRRWDRDRAGEIDFLQLESLLSWLGFAYDPPLLLQTFKNVDQDGTGRLNSREFLICMRNFRASQISLVQRAIAGNDVDMSGTLNGKEVYNTFAALGYIACEEAVAEAAAEAGLDPADDGLDLSEFWRLLSVYRWREGLTTQETADALTAFRRHDKHDAGEISTLDAGKALRWLGFQVSLEVLQDLISTVDVDETHMLDALELRMLVRRVHDRELSQARVAYEALRAEVHSQYLDQESVKQLVENLGFEPKGQQLQTFGLADGDGPVDCCCFLRLHKLLSADRRQQLRETGGFTPAALEDLKKCFTKYDRDCSGEIGQKELVSLVEDVFPMMAHDRERRPELQRLMESVDTGNDGSLAFPEFLHLMGQLQEIQDRERWTREQAAIQEVGFTKEEVLDFRKLFMAIDADCDGEITMSEAMRMMETICPLGAKNTAEFSDIFRAIVRAPRPGSDEDAPEMANFSEYLYLVKKLVDVNFAGVVERTKILPPPEEEQHRHSPHSRH